MKFAPGMGSTGAPARLALTGAGGVFKNLESVFVAEGRPPGDGGHEISGFHFGSLFVFRARGSAAGV